MAQFIIKEDTYDPAQYTGAACWVKESEIEGDRTPEAITINENGVTNTPDGKYYDPITVCVPSDAKTEDTASCTYTKNGSYAIEPASGHVLSCADVCVNVGLCAFSDGTNNVYTTEVPATDGTVTAYVPAATGITTCANQTYTTANGVEISGTCYARCDANDITL